MSAPIQNDCRTLCPDISGIYYRQVDENAKTRMKNIFKVDIIAFSVRIHKSFIRSNIYLHVSGYT